MSYKHIKDICDLYSGFPLSNKDFVENGNVKVILGGDISRYPAQISGDDENFVIEASDVGINLMLKEANIPKLSMEKTIKAGDLILRSRAFSIDKIEAFSPFPKKSSIIGDKPYIISNVFILLRPKIKILSQYLEWAINNFQNDLHQNVSKGATLVTININQLKEVVIPIPSLKIQENTLSAFFEVEKSRAIAEAKEFVEIEMLRGIVKKHSKEG